MSQYDTPTIDQFRPAVLRVLSDGQERSRRELCELVADHMTLSEDVRSENVPSGQPRYMNRIAWACSSFVHAGLAERPRRGHYRITDDGRAVDRRNLSEYSEKDMLEWKQWADYQQEIADRKTETELRKRLQEASPEFFEKAVIDVLWAMGYGGSHGEKKHVGRTGDGGIDGIIRQDALGLTNVYVQAKRYADTNTVSSSQIREFIGALDSRGASLGVFITTSQFTPSAKTTAENYRHGKIVLIDGISLTSLMLTYGVAVYKAREFTLFEIDDDFFDEDLT